MKIAILGDIHANIEALQAVVADLDELKPDRVFCVGDIIGYGAAPRECLALVRERGWPSVIGNWEVVLTPNDAFTPDNFNPYAKCSIYWTRGAMTAEEKEHCVALPMSIVEDGIQIAHATTGEDKTHPYLMKVEDARAAFDAAEAPVVFVGHTHVPFTFLDGDPIEYVKESEFTIPDGVKAIVNTGAVGQPRDKDPRASYVVYDTESRTVTRRRVDYDVEAAVKRIVDGGVPPILGERLRGGN